MALRDRHDTASKDDNDFTAERIALNESLNVLRINCGNPSLRTIADHSNSAIGYTTVGKVLTGSGLPTQEHLLAVVRVLLCLDQDGRLISGRLIRLNDPVLQPWRYRWRTLARLYRQGSTLAPAPAPAARDAGTTPNIAEESTTGGHISPARTQTRPMPRHVADSAAQTRARAPEPYTCPITLARNDGPTYAVAFSPDSTVVVSAGHDGSVCRWVPATGMQFGEPLTGRHRYVRTVAFSLDNALLAVAGRDGAVRLWSPATWQRVGEPLTGHRGYVFAVAFSPDNVLLASVGADGMVHLWNRMTRRPAGQPLTGHRGPVYAVAFSPDGTLLATGGGDGSVRLWNRMTRHSAGQPLTGHRGPVYALAFSPDKDFLATAGADGTVRLWHTATGKAVGPALTEHGSPKFAAAFSPDNNLLAIASRDGSVYLWNPDTQLPVGQPLTGHRGSVRAVAFSPDCRFLATAGDDGAVLLRRTGAASSGPAT